VGLETRRQSPRPRLILQIGKSIHELRPGDTLGRDGSVAREYFAPIRTVSRRHVLIDWRDGHWVVTLADRTRNLTQLDGQEITRGQAHPLDGEHVLRMSTRCEVRLVVEPGTA
jgi:predicted component of type VI protein secretion system